MSYRLIAIFLFTISIAITLAFIPRIGIQEKPCTRYTALGEPIEISIPELVANIAKYEGKQVMIVGIVKYYVSVSMFEDFWLEENKAKIPIKLGPELRARIQTLPSENSAIVIEGIVAWCELEGGFYYIHAKAIGEKLITSKLE